MRHRPAKCGCCGKSLRNAPVTAVERRQVIDIPPVKAVTTEHQMLTVKCGCGCETKAQAPDGVTAPVQYGPRIMGTGIYLWHGQFLSRDRACQALSDLFGCAPSPGALAAAARKTAGFLAPALAAITRHLIACEVVHFDETGFRTAGKLAWVHSASAGKYALFTVHAKRGKDGMKAAGVLPSFAGIAVHDAWAPYDTFGNVAGHALCGAHVAPGAGRGHRDRHGPRQDLGAAGHRRAPRPERGRRAPPAPQARPPSTRKPARSTRTGTARPRRPGSPSTPPARASSSRNGTPSPRG